MDIEIIESIARSLEKMALVTIIDVKGSVPRHAGSKMLVRSKAGISGTVGGGRGEAQAIEAAKACVAEKRSATLKVEMMGTEAAGQEMICGGTNRMLIEYLDETEVYKTALGLLAKGERVLFVKKMKGGPGGNPLLVSVALLDEKGSPVVGDSMSVDEKTAAKALGGGKPVLAEEEGIFYDPVFPEEKLLVLGGGHVGMALASLAVKLDFTVTVGDDRPEFVAPGRFPEAVHAALGGYTDIIEKFAFDSATYVVILTRGHLFDLECVRAVLKRNYRYAGFIGSARKTRLLLEQARSDGYDPQKVDALYAPIGLDIDAETPEELAICILGELIAVRRNARSLPQMNAARKSRRT